MHCLRSLLKTPTHRELDFVSVGWWAFLTSHLRRCCGRSLPELGTVKLYLKGNDVHKVGSISVDCKADTVLSFC